MQVYDFYEEGVVYYYFYIIFQIFILILKLCQEKWEGESVPPPDRN